MQPFLHLRSAVCACCVVALTACDKETTTTLISGAPAPARTHEYTSSTAPRVSRWAGN